MKEIFRLPDTLLVFYESNSSEKVVIEFNGEDVLYIIGTVDVCVLEGKMDVWGYTMAVDTPKTVLYSIGLRGLIPIKSADGQKAVVILEKSSQTIKWKTFMNKYVLDYNMFAINGRRLTPPKLLLELEEKLGCWFDLSKTPMSNQRLVNNEQWQGFCDELLNRSIELEPIRVLLAGYKNSGKSTMMCYFINKLLIKWDRILVLDFDIEQSEFSIPRCISAFVIDKPLLGPNFTHLMQPLKSYFFESNDVMTNIPLYNEIVEKIVNDIKTNDLRKMPCFINTMRFVKGPRLQILHNLISKIKPSDVVQLKFYDNQNLNLHSEIISNNTKSSLSYNLWYFISTVKNKHAKAPYLQHVGKPIRQQLVIVSYFSNCLESTDICFNNIVPYKINIQNINVQIKDVDELTQDESLDIINGNVIALCVDNHTNVCECVGFGVVRAVNKSTGNIYISTPVIPDLLKHVNQFRLGNVNLPNTFYMEEDDPDNQLIQATENTFSPSTSAISSNLSSQHLISSQFSEPPSKRPRQLKLFGLTKVNELSDSEINTINKSLIKMIVADYQPLSLVENVGFIEYSKKLQPLYSIPSRKVLTSQLLPQEYNVILLKIKSILQNVNDLSITTDMWTSDSDKSYITVTCHFIFDDQLYSPVIATKSVSDIHTGQNIAATLTNIINEWNIANKIITVISDNGSNIKNAITEHLLKHHHPCVAHTLNLSINEAINDNSDINQILKKCRTIVGHFKHNSNATEKLKDFQLQMNLSPLKVKQDVPTRWNSSLIMMERLVNIKAPLSATMSTLPQAPNYLNESEWEIILDSTHILKPFQIMTAELLSGEKYPTLSVVIPLIRGLQHNLRNLKTKTDIGDVFRNMLMGIVSRRLGILESNKIVAKATFLDPRFKKTAFDLLENASNAQKWVSGELKMIISKNTEMKNEMNTTVSTTAHSSNSTNDATKSLWEHFDNKVVQVKTTLSPNITSALMIRQYLDMPLLDRRKNPLEFWKQHKHTLPDLYKMQLKYLCIPATSVPSERVFSKTGLMTNDHRNKLSPKILDYIIFLNSNLNLF